MSDPPKGRVERFVFTAGPRICRGTLRVTSWIRRVSRAFGASAILASKGIWQSIGTIARWETIRDSSAIVEEQER